jgi:hypothetical protein
VQCEREKLVHRLGVRVGPALRGRRAVDPAGFLVERRVFRVIAVDLGRRRDEHPLAEAGAVLEHRFRPLDVREQRAAGLLDDQAHPDRGGEMEDHVDLVHELAHDGGREHGLDDEVEVGAVAERRDVLS